MSTIYDSREYVKRLKEAGMPEQQADILANENLLLIAEHLATKDDLKAAVEQLATKEDFIAINSKISSLELAVKLLESRLMVKLGGLMLGLVIAMTTVLGFLISIN